MFPGINPNLAAMSTKPRAPPSPTITTITYTATQATVFVSPPDFNGGAIISSFKLTRSPGSGIQTISGPNGGSTLYSGLTPNTNYNFIAYAVNEIGTSTIVSSVIKTLTDISLAPTGLVASALSSTRAVVSYTQPTSNNGSAITSYTAISNPGQITSSTFTSVSSLIIISGLTTATSYLFQIYATNGNGNSPNSAPSNQITTFSTAPWAPVIGTAVYVSGFTATVSFTASPYNGGSAITSYTAVSTPLGLTSTFSGSGSGSMTFNNLTVPNNYTFVVYATNAIGNSPNSASSNSINATGSVPNAPTNVIASVIGATTASIGYTAPAFNGGRVITSYTAVSNPGSISATTSTANSGVIRVPGLTPATSYSFNVYATNVIGNGITAVSNTITTPARAPDAPTVAVTGSATYIGNRTVRVEYTAPAYNGGSIITSYTAVSSPGGIRASTSTANSGIINVLGLNGLTTYNFRVYATNAIGTSSYSANSSNSVSTPTTAPGAPTITAVSLTAAATVTITYTAPADNGGSAITGYTAVSTPDGLVRTVVSGNIAFSGLSANKSYYFNLYAINAVGTSTYSANSGYVATWGSQIYETPGTRSNSPTTYSWIAPPGVTSVSVVAVGAGGGYQNTVCATPSTANASSWFSNTNLVRGGGPGARIIFSTTYYRRAGGTFVGDGGGAGGDGGCYPSGFRNNNAAGGGAGGYSGTGGRGASASNCGAPGSLPATGSGGAAGGGNSYLAPNAARTDGGGGVGLFGRGANGTSSGQGGSGGGNSNNPTNNYNCGGAYGGGGGSQNSAGLGGAGGGLGWKNNITVVPGNTYTVQAGAQGACTVSNRGGPGAVRIVWPASSVAGNRTFPITNVSTP